MKKLILVRNFNLSLHFSFPRMLIILIGVFTCLISGCKIHDSTQSQHFYTNFKNPPPSYLPTVYWFWNGAIEYDKIKWQLEEMKRSNTVGSVCILAWEGL